LEVIKRDNIEMLRFFGYADEPGEDTVNAFKLTKEEIVNLKQKPAGFREHNRNAIKEAIEISKDLKLVKTHECWGGTPLRMPPVAELTDPCVDEARERMGFKKKCVCQFTMEFD
jgi:hypothetical protein